MEVEKGKSLLDDLGNAVDSMRALFSSTQTPLTDDNTVVQTFFLALENVLRHCQKERSSLFGGSKDYWHYFKAGLSDSRTFYDMLLAVQNQPDVKTAVGQGRSFLRRCVVEGCLADAVQHCSTENPKLTNECYKSEAILHQAELVSRFLDIAYGLSEMQFSLGFADLNLDTSWPTFAKKVFVGSSPPRTQRTSKSRKAKTPVIADSDSDAEPLNDSPNSGFIPRLRKDSGSKSQDSFVVRARSTSTSRAGEDGQNALSSNSLQAVVVPEDATSANSDIVESEPAVSKQPTPSPGASVMVATATDGTPEEALQEDSTVADVALESKARTAPSVEPEAVQIQSNAIETCTESQASGNASHCSSAEHATCHPPIEHLVPLVKDWLLESERAAEVPAVAAELKPLWLMVNECRRQIATTACSEHERRFSTLSSERDQLKQLCASRDAELRTTHERCSSLEQTVDKLTVSHHSETQALSEQCADLEAQLKQSVKTAESSLTEVREQLEQTRSAMKQLQDEKEALGAQATKYETYQVDMDSLQLQLRSHNSEVERYKQELSSVRETSKREAEEWRERLSATERHHQQQLSTAQKRSKDLGDQLQSLSKQLTGLSAGGADITHETPRQSASAASVRTRSSSDADQDLMSKIQFQLSAQTMQLKHTTEELASKKSEMEKLQFEVLQRQQKQSGLEAMVQDAADSKETLQREIASLSEQTVLLTETSQSMKSEMSSLDCQLVSSNKERDLERVTNLKLNTQLEQLQGLLAAAEKQNATLQGDIERGQEQLLHVTRQKAALVNKQASLEDELATLGKKQWVDDSEVYNCMKCGTSFTLFNRRHHCRSCGGVFCITCCDQSFQLPASSKPLRVCIDCYERLTEQQKPVTDRRSSIPSPENFVVVTSEKGSPVRPLPVTEDRNSDENLASTTAGGKIVLGDSGDEAEAENVDQVESAEEAAARVTTPGTPVGTSDLPAELATAALSENTTPRASMEDIAAAAGPRRERKDSASSHSTVDSQRSSGRQFGSQSAFRPVDRVSSESNVAYTTHISRSTQSLHRKASKSSFGSKKQPDNQVLEMSDLPIKPGCYHTIPVLIDQPGARITWRFQTEPKGIAFGIAFKCSEMIEDATATTLLPLRRSGSHKQSVSGDWVAQQAGIYTLQFDNTSSTVTSCRLSYHVVITPAA